MDVANASLYDGAAAVVEAAYLARAQTGRSEVLVAGALHPHYVGTLRTLIDADHIRTVAPDPVRGTVDAAAVRAAIGPATACVILQYPNFFGELEEVEALCAAAKAAGALAVACADPVALALLTPPGALGADLCVGEAQSLGVPVSLGGPACGFFAGKKEYVRRFPGRIVGITNDSRGRRGFVLTLQTREQHIRREKATSNVCTNQGLIALMATVHLALLGKEGLREVANLCFQKTHYAATRALAIPGVRRAFDGPFMREVALRLPLPAAEAIRRGRAKGVLLGVDAGLLDGAHSDVLLVAATEKRTREEIDRWAAALADAVGQPGQPGQPGPGTEGGRR
jgi:glycine dehydrogenase subunit 1